MMDGWNNGKTHILTFQPVSQSIIPVFHSSNIPFFLNSINDDLNG